MEYLLLGRVEASRDGQAVPLGGRRQRAVLAALLLSRDAVVDTDRLVDMVWDDDPPAKPVVSLRAYVSNLRKVLADGRDDRLMSAGNGYRLDLGSDRLDVAEFETSVAEGKRLLDRGDGPAAERVLTHALHLWRGEPLTDIHDSPFVHDAVARLSALRANAVEWRFDAGMLRHDCADLIPDLNREVARYPLRERLWEHLLLALYRSGRRTEALAAYEQAKTIIGDELGVRPGPALALLAERIATQARELTVPDDPDAAGAELFGRVREFERLREELAQARAGRGRVALVMGDSGVGKTALAAAVSEYADARGVATVWVGHPGGRATPPSWAWTRAIRELGGGQITGEPVDLATATSELAAKRPTLIVLDDVQRADPFSLEVLELLAASIHRIPLIVVATWPHGSDDENGRAPLDRLVGRSDVIAMTLRGIAASPMADLIAHVTGITPHPDLVTAIGARTGGNPFYIKELTRLLYDSGRLTDETRTISGADVPDAVSGVVRSRMSALPEPTRDLLRVAAVLGGEFAVWRLADVVGCEPAAAADTLQPALVAGLLTESTGGPVRYGFGHGLVRDAVATQTNPADRTRLHGRIARAYAECERLGAEELYSAADHAWKAGHELDAAIALDLLDRARSDAATRSAYLEVAELGRRALDVCARLPVDHVRAERETELRLQLASAEAVASGQPSAEVLRALHDASEHQLGQLGAEQFVAAIAMRCLEATGAGRYHESRVLSDSLVEHFERTQDPIAGNAGYYIRSLIQFAHGDLDVSLETIGIMLADVPSIDAERYGELAAFELLPYGVAGWALGTAGKLEEAHATLAAGIARGIERNAGFSTAVLQTAQVQVDAIAGRYDGLADRAETVRAELVRLGIDQFEPGVRSIRDWARGMGPNGIDTAEAMRQAVADHMTGGRRIFAALYLILLADIEAAHHGPSRALETLRRARLLVRATDERVWEPMLAARELRNRAVST